jgi:hypothetical protein
MTSGTAAHSATAPIELDAIAALADPIGVLSVYADADPVLGAGRRPSWQAPVRAGLRELVKDARQTRPRGDWTALKARLDELEPELEALLDASLGARGRALFATVDGGEVHRVGLPVPLEPLVTLDGHARALPLFAALQDGAAAGAVTLSWDRLEAAEWQFDQLTPLETIELAAPEPRQQRPATNPAVPQSFPERDRFESAAGARILALLREAAERLGRQADARGWDALVAHGDPRLVDALADGWRTGPARLVRSPEALAGLPDAAAADRVGSTVRALREERTAELLQRLGDSPASTHDRLVLERSFDEGRVEHLLITVPSEPSRSSFSESLLRRALATGAGVTVVPPEAASLGEGGVSALLRW